MKSGIWDDDQPDDLANAKPARKARKVSPAGDPTRHIGCPLWWFKAAVHSGAELAVALILYRQHVIQGERTIAATNGRLMAELGVNRFAKYRAIRKLEEAGLITVRRRGKRALEVTFLLRRRARKERNL